MVGVAAAWAACFVALRWGLRDAPILWFAAARAVLAGVALLALGAVQRRPTPRTARGWTLIAVLAVVNVAVAFAAMFAGVAGAATGTAAVLANAQPLLILLPAWWWYGERPTRHLIAVLLLGFVGLVLVAAPRGGGRGAGLSLVAAGAATAGTLLVRRLDGVDLVAASGWQFTIGGAVLAGWAGWAEGPPAITWTPRFIAVLAFLSLIGTAGAFLVWFTEVRRARLDQLTSWTFLVPVLGLGLSIGILGERPQGWTLLGLGLVLASLWLAQGPRHSAAAAPTAPAPAVARPARSGGGAGTSLGTPRVSVRKPA